MSWIKNVWNRMFTDTDDVEEIDEEIVYEETPTEKKEKAPFRFPLIPDEEKNDFIHDIKRSEPRTKMPIFDEQEREILRKEEKPPIMGPKEAPVRSAAKPKRKAPELPIQNARRFEPSRSVSPVHGYNVSRPEPIQKKVEEQRESKLDREMYDEAIQEKARAGFHKPRSQVEPDSRSSYKKESVQPTNTEGKQESRATNVVSNTVSFVLAEREREEKALLLKEEALKETTDLNETSPEIELVSVDEKEEELVEVEPEIEPETEIELGITEQQPEVHTELDVDVEDATEAFSNPPSEEIEEPKTEATEDSQVLEVQVDSKPEVAPKREKTVPFNVLMLKSDKESLKNKTKSLSVTTPNYEKPVAQVTEAEKKTANLVEEVAPEPDLTDSTEPKTYQLPLPEYLMVPENDRKDEEWMEEQGERLVEALSHFQVKAEILSTVQGPAVTQFELKVAQGIKVSKIRNLADDLKLALAARDIRIQAPIPGKSSIGIEIPNRTSRAVRISEIIGSAVFEDSDSPLEAALGLDLTGKPVTLDLRKMPHGLIAGATGSGKSVCINSLLVSLLYKSSPRDLKLLLIDPKMVELAPYNHIPHLVSPVITDVKAATASLKWAVEEMERRYQLFAHSEVRDISRYNKRVKEKGHHAQHLPYILIVIDELADLMMMSPSDVEDSICRIAQKARACGIHLVIATQRPSVDVITGLIKSNIPTRIAFSVSSQVDSRTILDSQGAERLLGRGDMLYLGNGMSAPSRLQGTFVTDDEIEKVIEHVRLQGKPEYFFKEEELIKRSESPAEQDDLFEEACRFIMKQESASTSLLQRKFHIGYNRAARLMDLIEQHGFISEQKGSKARTVLITENEIEKVFS
ncbi:DNA translocase ftsK [Planococcus donghaensis MPA1U2]|uniref:DNA translocase ftsK n=1 Tax=Planococcus donghaensis MPA1U2 TaxID=933115 RepID=E7RE59_9BACL|nr:DNA translocase FtsK [Planococcus donghaensis]EGA90723.1 DNA translocase ftsK [Planococcus donghaensis MPA1U2]